jgi:hypothetical protein
MITAGICRFGQLKGHDIETPAHLRGGHSLNTADFEKRKKICRSKPKMV